TGADSRPRSRRTRGRSGQSVLGLSSERPPCPSTPIAHPCGAAYKGSVVTTVILTAAAFSSLKSVRKPDARPGRFDLHGCPFADLYRRKGDLQKYQQCL